MKNDYLEMRQLSVGYHGRSLIHDICISIQKGEIVILIGPNGSGKSTILKSLTRQLQLLGGQVLLAQDDLTRISGKTLSQKMAVVLTERIQPELMTCYDVVASGRYPYTGRLGLLTRQDEAKVEEALTAVHAQSLRDRAFDQLSDGQRQRILLARALCQEPEILILDEPTSFLDIHYKLELLSILRDLARQQQMTVIMSLHEIDLAQKLADRVICVKGETLFRYGLPEDIFQEDIIRDLYEISSGSFDPCFGSLELPKPSGTPEIMVLSAAGSGIPVYRKLQRQGTPFIAGILYENDMDYQLARLLAMEVITEKPFCAISDATFERAAAALGRVPAVINAGVCMGDCNKRMADLIQMAEQQGKMII